MLVHKHRIRDSVHWQKLFQDSFAKVYELKCDYFQLILKKDEVLDSSVFV